MPRFEEVLNSLLRIENIDIYVTESNAGLNFRQQETTHIMENIVYNELCIRGYNVDTGMIEMYGRNKEKQLLTCLKR